MKPRLLLRCLRPLILLCSFVLFVGAARAEASPPDTPAGKQFAAWLGAFNAADRAKLTAYHDKLFPFAVASRDVGSLDDELGLSGATHGFEVKKSESASPTSLTVTLKEHASPQFARVTMRVDAAAPHRIVAFEIHPIVTPDEFLSAEERRAGAGPLDDTRRRALVDGIARELDAHYIFPDVGKRMVTALRAHAAHGDYDKITAGDVFAKTLTKDLRDISHDLHLRIVYGPKRPPPSAEDMRAFNFGFGPIERLPGNVAHVVINEFPPVELVHDGVAGLMSKVADADALIIDLRGNHGGDPNTVALVASYVFDATPVHLNDMFSRDTGKTEQSWTRRDVSGSRFGATKPIYVLTSRETGSGGEELAYDLQSLRRAKLIGETTAGAANPADIQQLNDWWAISVPNGRPINPVTKTNWEGVGVKPDIAVSRAAALDEARKRLAQELAAATKLDKPAPSRP